MVDIRPRSAWQDPAMPVKGPAMTLKTTSMIPAHYTAASTIPSDTASYLRSIQRDYTVNRGYSIGYNFAVDKAGVAWECRGFDIRCAANKGVNASTIAILCLVDGANAMNEAMVTTFRAIAAEAQNRTPQELVVVGHRDIGSTSCPGDGIYGQVKSGALDPGEAPAPTPPTPPTTTPTPPTPTNWWDALMKELPTLKQGASGAPVKRMQHLIAANGFMNEANVANYDGAFGSGTATALKNFQGAAGIPVDAVCGPITWGALMHTIDGIPTIKKGASGADVKKMQHLLAAAGFMQESNTSNYDGAWGNGTENAKVKFDNAKGLTPSPPSDCGQKSWTRLLKG